MSTSGIPDRKRRSGRPGPENNADVRQQILDSAEQLFALKGFAASTVREIAQQVDVNPAMVHYYFGSKQSLLQAVMDNALEPLAESVAKLSRRNSGLIEFTQLMISVVSKHHSLPQLITREVFLPGGCLQHHFLETLAPRLGGRLPEIIRQEQAAGRVSKKLDENIAALLILSMCFFPFIALPAAKDIFKMNFDSDTIRAISQHIAQVLQEGVLT